MKKLLFLLQAALFIAMNFFLLITALEILQPRGTMSRLGYDKPEYNHQEEYDASLLRLDNISKLTSYCDSVYSENVYAGSNVRFESGFPLVASAIVRKRFYHGYSLYGFGNNPLAMFASKLSMNGLSAIVVPDDILKYPYAACSQQSIVLMKVLQQKGFKTREIALNGKLGGHFCFEVYYNGAWHFVDPNMEPDMNVLYAYNQPGIAFLAGRPDILLMAYKQYPKEKVLDLFSHYSYGKVNAPAAPRAYLFQKVTQFLSYTLWSFFLLAFIRVRKKYLRLSRQPHVRNRRVYFPQLQPGTPQALNVGY
ncbi:MAG: hypothetical protein ACT4OJ_11630 [Bacteroidota bacterium]